MIYAEIHAGPAEEKGDSDLKGELQKRWALNRNAGNEKAPHCCEAS